MLKFRGAHLCLFLSVYLAIKKISNLLLTRVAQQIKSC